MDLNNIINKSKHTKQIADKILESTDLVTILSKFGDTEIIGSYKYNVMYGPGLDIVVKTNSPRSASFKTL